MIVIVDYGVGNLTSILNMLKRAGVNATISCKEEDVAGASKILLPGMGHFDNCMQLFNSSGLRTIIEKKVLGEKIPFLGICVGLQMLMEGSEEGSEPGLGWVSGKTVGFNTKLMDVSLKIPHMDWQEVQSTKFSPLWEGLEAARFYFAHSFHVAPENADDILLKTNYGYDFTAGIEKDNILGVQFHPEKSHRFGMQMLKNFAANY